VTYFSVLAAAEAADELEAMLDVYDASRAVAPYRYYLEPDDIEDGGDVHVETVDGIPAHYCLRTTNPEGEHGGWELGGRWHLHFKPRDPADPELIRVPGPSGGPVRPREDWVAGGPKRALDINGTRDAVAAHAARQWEQLDAGRRHAMDRDAYIRQERDRAIPGYALLTESGMWIKSEESTMALYLEQANEYVDRLPGDTWLFIVECHF